MDAKAYIQQTYTILSDISPKNYTKLARNSIDGKLYVLKFLKAYDISIYRKLKDIQLRGIANIFEVIESPEGLYVVEEYVDGVSLDQYIEKYIGQKPNTKMSPDVLLVDLICGVLKALDEIHKFSIIHRDIKPENIMVDKNGCIKLIDFNISREFTGVQKRDTFAMGTKDFAAPEQYGFMESDPRTDIYGVGATTKYLMEKYKIYSDTLNGFVNKSMEFNPDDRFMNAGEALYYLTNYRKILQEQRQSELEEQSKNSWRRFLPPGYRTGNPTHILIASFMNFLLFVYTFYTVRSIANTDTKKGQYTLVIILIWCWYILITGFSFDYLGVQKIFNIDKLEGSRKTWSIIAVDVFIVIITMFIGAFFINKV